MKRLSDIPYFIIGHYCTILRGKYSKNTPTEVIREILTDWTFEQVRQKLEGKDIIILAFLLSSGVTGNEIGTYYDFIKKRLFGFKVIEVTNEESKDTCDNCAGDGYSLCDSCDNGQASCYECGGDGEDSDGDTCNECGGDGEVTCDECGGDGSYNCEYCDGTGEVIDEDYVDANVLSYVSFDKDLYGKLELKTQYDSLPNDFLDYIQNNYKVLLLESNEVYGEISSSDLENPESGDLFLEGRGKDFEINFSQNRIKLFNLN